MDIDKFYRVIGSGVKKLFNKTIKKPIQNFNVDNRAQKTIENPKASPWHETTQKVIHQIKKDSKFEQFDSKNEKLLDRLKSVKVDDLDKNMERLINEERSTTDKKLPQERMGVGLPFVFYKPVSMQPGKITVLDTLDIIFSHKKDKLNVEEIAAKYNILENDVENLIKYVDIFMAFDKDRKEIPLFIKREDKSHLDELKSGTESNKQIHDK